MRRGRRCLWGLVAIILGLIIILSLVLPSAFWWFALAAALIGLGYGIFAAAGEGKERAMKEILFPHAALSGQNPDPPAGIRATVE